VEKAISGEGELARLARKLMTDSKFCSRFKEFENLFCMLK
jgi:hypothetical protein